jgi:hypothetical protein
MVEVNVVEAPVALLAAQPANSFGCISLYVEGDYLIIILAINKARVFIIIIIGHLLQSSETFMSSFSSYKV